MRRRMIALLLGSVSSLSLAPLPANALLGVGDVVIDPTNLVQNILTATHTLEQINNQIQQLQHEAQMLVNQAEDLKRLVELISASPVIDETFTVMNGYRDEALASLALLPSHRSRESLEALTDYVGQRRS